MRHQAAVALKILRLADTVLLAACVAFTLLYAPPLNVLQSFVILLITPCYFFLLTTFGVYESNRTEGYSGILRKVVSALVAGAFGLCNVLFLACSWKGVELALRFTLYSTIVLVGQKVLLYLLLPL